MICKVLSLPLSKFQTTSLWITNWVSTVHYRNPWSLSLTSRKSFMLHWIKYLKDKTRDSILVSLLCGATANHTTVQINYYKSHGFNIQIIQDAETVCSPFESNSMGMDSTHQNHYFRLRDSTTNRTHIHTHTHTHLHTHFPSSRQYNFQKCYL